MTDKLFIDECLSAALVAVAKNKGVAADYGPHIGKAGWQDWNIVPFPLENNYIVVTNNRRHFLEEYSKHDLHNGLIIVVPNVDRAEQVRLVYVLPDHQATRFSARAGESAAARANSSASRDIQRRMATSAGLGSRRAVDGRRAAA